MAKLKFAGRKKEIEKFKKFIGSEAKRILLIIGKQGIGKTRLLEQFELECYGFRDLECLVYSYQIKGTDRPEQYLYQIMDEIWMRKNIFSRIIDKKGEIIKKSIWQIPGVGQIFKNITQSVFRDPRRPVTDRFKIFLQEIVEGFKNPNQRFVLFIDPLDKLTTAVHKDAWRAITQHLPYQVKVVIAQREKDVLANCIELTEHEEVECWTLGCLSDKVTKDLVKSELAYAKPTQRFVDDFVKRYKGYPLFMDGAIKLLRKRKEFTLEALKKLPAPKLAKLLYDKLDDEERNLVNHLSILEVPVNIAFLRNFTRIKEGKLDGLLRRYNVRDVMKEEENGKRTYQIYHQTFKDFVIREMGQTDVNITALHRKASKAFLQVLERDDTNYDALKYSIAHLMWGREWNEFATLILERLQRKKIEYVMEVNLALHENLSKMMPRLKLRLEEKALLFICRGVVHLRQGNIEEAQVCHEKSLEIHKKLRMYREVGADLHNIAGVYERKKDLINTLRYLQKSLSYYKKAHFKKGINDTQIIIQRIKKKMNEKRK